MAKVIFSKVSDGSIMSFNCGYVNADGEGNIVKPDLTAIAAKHTGLSAGDLQVHEWTKADPVEADFEKTNISELVADDLILLT